MGIVRSGVGPIVELPADGPGAADRPGRSTRSERAGTGCMCPRKGQDEMIHVTTAGVGQSFLAASAPPLSEPRQAGWAVYDRLGRFLAAEGSLVVHERLFGSNRARQAVLAGRARALAKMGMVPHWPVTYVEGRPPWGDGLAGVLVRTIRPDGRADAVWTVTDGPSPIGRGWRRLGATFVTLQGVNGLAPAGCPSRPDRRPRQADRMIARAEGILRTQGLSWTHVARTWFYLSGIGSWYERFDRARGERYGLLGVSASTGAAPASTTVGAETHVGGAGVLDLLAVAGPTRVRAISSCRGSGLAFSGGVVIEEEDVKVIEVSGTAALDADGGSLHPGDARAQIDAALEGIESLIRPERATLRDICSGTAFVKRPEDASVFRRALVARGLEPLPVVCVVADFRRPELLFEMDAQVAVGPDR